MPFGNRLRTRVYTQLGKLFQVEHFHFPSLAFRFSQTCSKDSKSCVNIEQCAISSDTRCSIFFVCCCCFLKKIQYAKCTRVNYVIMNNNLDEPVFTWGFKYKLNCLPGYTTCYIQSVCNVIWMPLYAIIDENKIIK